MATELARIVPWLAGERPGRLGPALTPFVGAETPWSAQDLADAVGDLLLRTGCGPVRRDRIRTRPAALLASLLRQLDPQVDHPALAVPVPATPPVPCTRADCDGHGWILLEDGRVAKCPDCPPGVRSYRVDTDVDELAEEPPF